MAIYVAVFTASTVLFLLGDYTKKKQRVYVDIIAILLLSLLAGFRAGTIGTDTRGYILPMIRGAISSGSIKEYFQYSWMQGYQARTVVDFEIGYALVIYLTSILFKSVVVTQTVLELLTVLPVYYALHVKKDVPIWFGMLVFMLQFFNESMNMNRQSIAMAFMLLAVTYWMKSNKKKSVFFMICAVLFHTSGLLGIGIILLYEYVGRDRNVGIKASDKMISINYVNMVIAIIVGVAVLIGVQLVVTILTQVGLAKYVGYILGDIHFMPNQIINVLPPSALFLLSFKYFRNHQNEWAFYVVMIAYVMIVGQFTSVNQFGGRIRLYFMIFAIFAYPLVCKYSKYRRTTSTIVISYLMFYWWFYYVFNGTSQTVPYVMIH